jgi:(p)ppGpp synthase/HD superfamily hydrolase
MSLVEDALILARTAHHNGVKRGRGLPYIIHPMEVCANLTALGIDDQRLLAAALLHDVLEDCGEDSWSQPIKDTCGEHVYQLVMALTKPANFSKMERYHFMIDQIQRSWEVGLIKMSDRLSNIRTLNLMTWASGKKQDYLEEARSIAAAAMPPPNDNIPMCKAVNSLRAMLSREIEYQLIALSVQE